MTQTGGSLLARHALRLVSGFGSVPVVYGAAATRGLPTTRPLDLVSDGGRLVQSVERVVTVPSAWVASLSGFGEGVTITVDGTACRVGEVRVTADEALTTLVVARR